jgi:hypothetical protein
MHFRLHYLYRDAHNYKRHGSVLFTNPNNRSLEELETIIRTHLIDGEWFIHTKWQVPDLHFAQFNFETDHQWHEFNSLEYTDQPAGSTTETIEQLLERITT